MQLARALILTAAFPVLVIVNLIENWGKKVDENGDLGLLLCDVITAAVISDGTCHEYFSLKWISDNSESNNNVDSRVERNDSLKIIVRSQFYFITC